VKDSLQILIRKLIHLVFHSFYIFPIKSNRIFFSSYDANQYYNCNPKYISEHLNSNYKGKYEMIWSFANPLKYKELGYIKPVKKHSLLWCYYLLTSHIIILNTNPDTFIPKRKGQYVINTWHAGGAYKTVGFSKNNISKLDLWRSSVAANYIDLYLSSSKAFTESNIKGYRYNGRILKSGMPRNDIFFNEEVYLKIRQTVRTNYNITDDYVIILYAPTFRGGVRDSKTRSVNLPYNKIPQKILNKKVKIFVREHYNEHRNQKQADNVIDVSSHPEMQELLCAADILITDYSSSIWDFAITGKPCFLFVPDLSEYMTKDRGFFIPIEKWPGIICGTEDELISNLENINLGKSKTISENHLKYMESYEDGTATKQVSDLIVLLTEKKGREFL